MVYVKLEGNCGISRKKTVIEEKGEGLFMTKFRSMVVFSLWMKAAKILK